MAQKKRSAPKRTAQKRRSHWVKSLIDSYSLTIALAVELAITMISFWIIAPDTLTGIGFVAIASIVVLFAVRSWMKAMNTLGVERFMGRSLWASFAIVALFFNMSFALSTTETQTVRSDVRVTLQDDARLRRLDERLANARANRDRLSAQYDDAVRESTVRSLLAQLDRADEQIEDLEREVDERENLIVSGEASRQAQSEAQQLSAERIFYAIPTAIEQDRWIELIVFFFIFLGLELTIVMAVTEQTSTTKRGNTREQKVQRAAADKRLAALEDRLQDMHSDLIRRSELDSRHIADALHDVYRTCDLYDTARQTAVEANTADAGESISEQKEDVTKEPDASTERDRVQKPNRSVTKDTSAELQHRTRSKDVPSRSARISVAKMLIASYVNQLSEDGFDAHASAAAAVLSDPAVKEQLASAGLHTASAQSFLEQAYGKLFELHGPTGYRLIERTAEGRIRPNYTNSIIISTLSERTREV